MIDEFIYVLFFININDMKLNRFFCIIHNNQINFDFPHSFIRSIE